MKLKGLNPHLIRYMPNKIYLEYSVGMYTLNNKCNKSLILSKLIFAELSMQIL